MSDEYEGYPPDRDDTPSGLWVSLLDDIGTLVATQPWIPGERIVFTVAKSTILTNWQLGDGTTGERIAHGWFAQPLVIRAGDTAYISIEAEVTGR